MCLNFGRPYPNFVIIGLFFTSKNLYFINDEVWEGVRSFGRVSEVRAGCLKFRQGVRGSGKGPKFGQGVRSLGRVSEVLAGCPKFRQGVRSFGKVSEV